MLHEKLTATTKRKPRLDAPKTETESKHNTKESHQTTREEIRRRKKQRGTTKTGGKQ